MTDQAGAVSQSDAAHRRARHRGAPSHAGRRPRKRLSPATVIGELLFATGIATLGFFGWQYVNTQIVVPGKQLSLAAADSSRWAAAATPPADPEAEPGAIPVMQAPDAAEVFGVLYVPAFGKNYANRMAETTDWWTVLNLDEKGIGHYEGTQMPGEPGNFAVAGHRSGPLINSFREVMELRVGDPMYVETPEGWYTYRFRNVEYVLPTEVDVLNPFPRLEGTPGDDRIMTLTTCHPKEAGSAERAIAYAVFEGYRPLTDGPPPELARVNSAVAAAASAATAQAADAEAPDLNTQTGATV